MLALLFAGCGGDVVAPPSRGMVDSGDDSFNGGGFAPAFPQGGVAQPGNTAVASTAGSHRSSSGSAGSARPAVSGSAGLAAAIAALDPLAGPGLRPDGRSLAEIERAAADFPALAAFDRATAKQLPPPDRGTVYEPLIDPARGTLPDVMAVPLTGRAADIISVQFSDPSVARAVVLRELTVQGRPHARLEAYDLASGKLAGAADLPDRAALLAVAPDGLRAAVRLGIGLEPATPAASQVRIDVYDLDADAGTHLVGWEPGRSADSASVPAVPLAAAFVTGDQLATLSSAGDVVLWDVAKKEEIYRISTGSHGPLLTTPGRAGLAIFTGTTFALFDSADGRFRGHLAPPKPTLALCRDAGFSPDGTELAAVLRRPAQSVAGWNMAAGRSTFEIEAPLEVVAGLHFTPGEYLLAGGVLFDLSQRRAAWQYPSVPTARLVEGSPDLRHWLIVERLGNSTLEPISAPTAAVASAAATAEPLPPPTLGPGDAVAVRTELSDPSPSQNAVESALTPALLGALVEKGMRPAASAPRSLTFRAAAMPTGEQMRLDLDGSGRGQTVPAYEITYKLTLADGGKTLWTADGHVPTPALVTADGDESPERALLNTLWAATPAAVSQSLRTMPAVVDAKPLQNLLGTTRLWISSDDLLVPGQNPLAAARPEDNPMSGPDPALAAAARPPVLTHNAQRTDAILALAVVPEPRGYLVTVGSDDSVRFFDPQTLYRKTEFLRGGGFGPVTVRPNGRDVAYATNSGEVRLFDVTRQSNAGLYSGAAGELSAMTFASDKVLLGGTTAGKLLRWTDPDRKNPAVLYEGTAHVTALAAAPGTNVAAAGFVDGTVRRIEPESGRVTTLATLSGPVTALAVSPDGRTVVAGSDNGAVLLRPDDGFETGRLDRGPIVALAFHPQGRLLATGGDQGRVVLWQPPAGRTDAWEQAGAESRIDGAGPVVSIVFSADGRGLAVVGTNARDVRLYDLTAPVGGAAGFAPHAQTQPNVVVPRGRGNFGGPRGGMHSQ